MGTFGAYFVVIAIVANILIGSVVFAFHPKSATHRTFFFLTLVAAAWTAVNYFSTHQATSGATLFFARLELGASVLYSLSVFLTVHTFPHEEIRLNKKAFVTLIAVTVPVLILTQTPLVFHTLTGTGTAVNVTPGIGIAAYGALSIFFVIASLTVMIRRFNDARGIHRRQLGYLLSAVLLSYITAFFTNFVLVNIFKITSLLPVAPLLSLVFVLITGYAIVTQHLFDIRIFISRAIIYSLLVSFSLAVYGLIVNISTSVLRNTTSTVGILVIALITAAALSFAFEPLQIWIAEKTDSWLFKKEYEQQEVTRKLGEQLASAIGLDEALDAIMHKLSEVLHLNHAAAYVFQTGDLGKQVVKRSRQIGYSDPSKLTLSERDFIVDYFTKHPETVLLSNLENQYTKEEHIIEGKDFPTKYMNAQDLRLHAVRKVIIDKLKSLDAAVVIPLQMQTSVKKEDL